MSTYPSNTMLEKVAKTLTRFPLFSNLLFKDFSGPYLSFLRTSCTWSGESNYNQRKTVSSQKLNTNVVTFHNSYPKIMALT